MRKILAVAITFVMVMGMLSIPVASKAYSSAETGCPSVEYSVHRQTYGWEKECKVDGQTSGTVGEGKRLEGIKINVVSDNYDIGIKYRTHIQSYGWESQWKADGAVSGTEGEAKRLEAIQIELTGADKDKFDVYYRVHAQSYGWLGWAKDGECAGTASQGKRLEAIEIVILPVGKYPSQYSIAGSMGCAFVDVAKTSSTEGTGAVSYMTHVQSYGDQKWVADGSVAGTFGEAKRLEQISIKVDNTKLNNYTGGITYKTHVQSYGWMDWVSDGAKSGTSGKGKRLEGIKIKLTGELANYYDVYYRVHAQSYGWLGWAKNGAASGTEGYAKRLEAIQIVVVPKNTEAPNSLPAAKDVDSFVTKSGICSDSSLTKEQQTELLNSYFNNTIKPKYKLFLQSQEGKNLYKLSLEGILNADVADYNNDGVLDLMVVYNDNESKNYDVNSIKADQFIEVYSINDDEVVKLSSNKQKVYYTLGDDAAYSNGDDEGWEYAYRVAVNGKLYIVKSDFKYYKQGPWNIDIYSCVDGKMEKVIGLSKPDTMGRAIRGEYVQAREYKNGTKVKERIMNPTIVNSTWLEKLSAEGYLKEKGIDCSINWSNGEITFKNENVQLYKVYYGDLNNKTSVYVKATMIIE